MHDGKPNTAMSVWKQSLSDEEILDVSAYVRRLESSPVDNHNDESNRREMAPILCDGNKTNITV